MERKEAELDRGLKKKVAQFGTREREIEQLSKLKAELAQAGMNVSLSTQARLADLIANLQRLENEGWSTSRTAEEMHALFVRLLLGNHLRCYRCQRCGVNSMVNREPYCSHYDSKLLLPRLPHVTARRNGCVPQQH